MAKIAFLFPGQGSQAVGMAQELAGTYDQARETIEKADAVLGESLSGLMFNGPQEELTKTFNAQPALLSSSVAILNVLREHGIDADYVAGHSLGEYSALVAAGVLSFEDAVQAVRKRGLLMEEAVPNGQGGMAAILGMDRAALTEVTDTITAEGFPVQLANINCPGQIVISGSAEGVEKACGLAKEKGAKRALPLNVSGPFHSSLMKPAAENFRPVLDEYRFQDAGIPLVANVNADVVFEAEKIKSLLVSQLYSPVLFEDMVEKLIERGVDTFVEIGPGKVLCGLVKKVNRRAVTLPVYDQETLDAAIAKLKGE